jgi:hypothetical protein
MSLNRAEGSRDLEERGNVAAPIVVEVVQSASSASPDPALSEALIDSCSAAAGPGGCVLDAQRPLEARARVVVTFSSADAGARVEVLAPIAGGEQRSREVAFRGGDPRLERFRAAGLIVAGLVSGAPQSEPPERLSTPAPRAPGPSETPRRVGVRLQAQSGWNAARPWGGAAIGAEFDVVGPAFLALSGSYDQTWTRDPMGIAGQRTAIGAGGGIAAPLIADRLELRVRLALELQELRASIVQPSTRREDEGSRTATGFETSIDLVMPIAAGLSGFCGGRFDWWGGTTTVRVQAVPAETIGAWMASIAVGLSVRF